MNTENKLWIALTSLALAHWSSVKTCFGVVRYVVRKPFHSALIRSAGRSLRQPISPGKKLLFQGEQEEEDVLMPAAILSPPAARLRETCLDFSSGEMCEEKTQAIITCNSRLVNNKREREMHHLTCLARRGVNSLPKWINSNSLYPFLNILKF